ncbi:MAG: phosphodiester glycosidase family protein [Flavobacteriales bacterium]|nr:phosphodiester glycosidase family protein [Flavobacteriales bacterium]
MKISKLIKILNDKSINTWFDLGMFIDSVKEEAYNYTRSASNDDGHSPLRQDSILAAKSFKGFKKRLGNSGIGFITFHYSVDGVTVEIQKYAKALQGLIPGIPIHFIAGDFLPEAERFIDQSIKRHVIKEISGFDSWKLYEPFFSTKLERGSDEYNKLVKHFWDDTCNIVEKLGSYIEEQNIKLLYLVNVCSNPGNVSLSLASALISEYLRIPVINNNHDFYWEGGNSKVDLETKNLKAGPRDFFFRNSNVGEFFSQIEVLFPWESRQWLTVNINRNQTEHVINVNGHNPANVSEIGTAVDTKRYTTLNKRKKINAFIQVHNMLAHYKKKLAVVTPSSIKGELAYDHRPLLLGHRASASFDFVNNNIVFLQPTRLMPRKRIEVGFTLIERLFENEHFKSNFESNPGLSLTFLITGPIPMGQKAYTKKLISVFGDLLKSLPANFRDRVYLGFLFSEFDSERFKRRYPDPVDIPKLYNIASLIMLPSETEGRGLPLIEATACGIPIFCRRYYPENVYAEVIGEHLSESERLRVLDFKSRNLKRHLVQDVADRVFFPQNFLEEVEHNKAAVEHRYSLNSLSQNLDGLLHQLYIQISDDTQSKKEAIKAVESYVKDLQVKSKDLSSLINEKSRHFMPGFGRLKFMTYLKSLIDPSFFRVEEQQKRAMAMRFARKLVAEDQQSNKLPITTLHRFYNIVDNVFKYYNGFASLRHDHSFSYRHRNDRSFPYQDLTVQEMTGLVNMIYNDVAKPQGNLTFKISPHFFTDWNLALFQLTNSQVLEIDDRPRLVKMLKDNVPLAYFPGQYVKYEIEFFVLQPLRARLGLKIEEELTSEHLKKAKRKLAPVYIFCQKKALGKWYTAAALDKYLKSTDDKELQLLYKEGICKLVTTDQWTVGVHFKQLGSSGLKTLNEIKNQGGFIITNGDNAPVMTDMINLDRFHIGKVENNREIISSIMGVKQGNGFIQFVPAGVRATLAYPTPVQTAKDFSEALHGPLFKKLADKMGERQLFDKIRADAELNGTPLAELLEKFNKASIKKSKVEQEATYQYLTGVYSDNMPWSGVLATVHNRSRKWRFEAVTSGSKTQTVKELVRGFESLNGRKAVLAWNGGYILNAELVGKLALSESYIGSPLGMLISNGTVECPPLFNKPAFIIYKNGKIDIEKVCCGHGIQIKTGAGGRRGETINFEAERYNKHSGQLPCFYDLLYDKPKLKGDGNTIIRLAGTTIKEIISTAKGEKVQSIPVGITLSLPPGFVSNQFKVGQKLTIAMKNAGSIEWDEVEHAIEAGPMLLDAGKDAIDMKVEGWKTTNSITTQAARLDFTDMRGPKIAVGLDAKGNVMVLTINGRILESVGATHGDMAAILKNLGAVKAMGFDPGGSSTLVMNGRALNISPYNSEYEKNIYALPPEPRAVANAIIGWREK